jgi:hypothetical protein
MRLLIALAVFLFSFSLTAQTTMGSVGTPASDPYAIQLAQKAVASMTGGTPISDVTLNGSVTSILGSDYETGTGVFQASGTSNSRVDLNLTNGMRSDIRNVTNGTAGGAWSKNGASQTPYAGHNCWTDAAWFFPVLSSLTQTANSSFVFKYIGQEQHGGANTQHIQVFQPAPDALFQHLSTVDFYLDTNSFLPLAIAFNVHPDMDARADIPAEVRFASYQTVSGVQVPFRLQKLLNGGLVLDVTVTNVAFNTGISSSTFILQ